MSAQTFITPTVIQYIPEAEEVAPVQKVQGLNLFEVGPVEFGDPIYIYYLADGTVSISQIDDEFAEWFVKKAIVRPDWTAFDAALEAEQLTAFGFSVIWNIS